MAVPSDDFKRTKAFFHSQSKTNTEADQFVFESQYKSSHSVKANEVWADDVDYAVDETAADTFVTNNPTVVKKYTLQTLTEIPGSNGQAWYIDDVGAFIRPFVSPVDVPHPTTSLPSFGYEASLYQSDNTLITPTTGVFIIDYYAGIVAMQEGYTPSDLGWGTPKITCYVYIGQTVSNSGGLGFTLVDNEKYDIAADTSTVILANTPISNSEHIYRNGQRMAPTDDYSVSQSTVTFVTSLITGEKVLLDYRIL